MLVSCWVSIGTISEEGVDSSSLESELVEELIPGMPSLNLMSLVMKKPWLIAFHT